LKKGKGRRGVLILSGFFFCFVTRPLARINVVFIEPEGAYINIIRR
jgi:hypothetical protein